MSETLRHLRRAITQRAIGMAVAASAGLPVRSQRAVVRRTASIAGAIPVLRQKVIANMRLALGSDPRDEAVRRYFQHAGWFLSSALATFHHGLARVPVVDEVKLGPTVAVLDKAFAEGRGVILSVPHWSGHELVGGVIARRHPMVMLVRQAPRDDQAARKAHWYRALGVETVLRPVGASTIKDAVAFLKVLKQGKMLAITPDLLAAPGQGVEISLFGRRARLHGGAFGLALAVGAPIVRVSGAWQSDASIALTFERAPPPPSGVGRDAAIQACMQEWCCWFEDRLRVHPENWLFWLDRRWGAFLRETPRAVHPQ